SVRALPLSVAALVGVGWGGMVLYNSANTLLQLHVPDALRGRVMSIYSLIMFGEMPLGALWAGTLAQFIGAPQTLVVSALIALVFGHGARFILAGWPGVLHVRFIAPFPARIERVMRRAGVTRAEAERRVRAEDQRRAAYIRQFYEADWHSLDPFHLILNTEL